MLNGLESESTMNSHMLIADGFDVEPIRQSLSEQPELFGLHRQRAQFYMSPHSGMSDIWVRYNDIANYKSLEDMSTFNDRHESVWYPSASRINGLRSLIFKLMQHVEGERLGGILITKVPPGGSIAAHTDAGWHAEYYSKFYVPIQNDPGARFCFTDGVIEPNLGEIYWFDNSVVHWVENNSNKDRIAMIVCIKTDHYPAQQYDSRKTIREFKGKI
jgi:hypothetical protein